MNRKILIKILVASSVVVLAACFPEGPHTPGIIFGSVGTAFMMLVQECASPTK